MEQHPSIDIFGVSVSEPVTMLTDIILAVFCFYFFIRIRKCPSAERGKYYFAQFFLWMSACTFFGGVMGHGFLPYFGAAGKYPAWVLTVVTMFWLQLAVIDLLRNKVADWVPKALQGVSILMVPIFLTLTFGMRHFSYSIFHNIAAALMIIPILIFCLVKYKTQGTELVLASLLLSSVIPYFQINRIGINQWFTYHDVCHVMMLAAFYVLYLGATKLYKHIEYQNKSYRRFP